MFFRPTCPYSGFLVYQISFCFINFQEKNSLLHFYLELLLLIFGTLEYRNELLGPFLFFFRKKNETESFYLIRVKKTLAQECLWITHFEVNNVIFRYVYLFSNLSYSYSCDILDHSLHLRFQWNIYFMSCKSKVFLLLWLLSWNFRLAL